MPFINHQYLNDIEAELAQAGSVESFVWSTAADTDVGRVRSRNEDAFFCTEEQGLWIVADGMGCLLYTSPSPRDQRGSRMPSSA